MIAYLGGAAVAGCHSSANADPAATYQDIYSDFVHGNLIVGQQKARKARQDFASGSDDWSMKFRLLEAEIVGLESRRSDAIALLDSPGVSYPTTGDLAIKRDLICGLAHLRLGDAEQSDREMQEARRLSDASHSALNGEVLRTEALVQLYRSHLPEAAELTRESLQIARNQRDSFLEASDLSNLGLITLQMKHYDEAISLLKQAAESSRKIQARTLLQFNLGNRGLANFYLGDFEQALSDFRQTEEEAGRAGTANAQVDWLMDAASSYYMLGDIREAKSCFERARLRATSLNVPAETADIETNLAFIFYRQGQLSSAKMHVEAAMKAAQVSQDKSEELAPLFLQALLAIHQKNGEDPEKMLLQVYQKSASDRSVRGQIENALAKLYESKNQSNRADLWYRKSILTFEQQRAEVSDEELKLPFFANGEALYRDYAYFLIASQKQRQALQLLDVGRARTLSEGLGVAMQSRSRPEDKVDVQAVARKLNGAILFYSLGEEKSYLWAVTPRDTQIFLLPGKSAIAAQVRAYQRAILRSSDPLREENVTAKDLYKTLVEPAAEAIPKGSKVFIIPDDILNVLNFETLLTTGPDASHYWIEDVTISNANSIRLLSAPHAPNDYARKLLLIGNPVTHGTGYETLANAFSESRGIEKQFSPDSTTVVTQSGAVPAAYAESHPEKFEYIHFVAHGTASELSPLDSAVVLSPPSGNPDQFKLYARDIMRFPLHAKLVTVSACYGSGSRAYAGEGLVGLSWAFLRAGSHNVIAALWEVNDASTPLLMDRLYGALQAGHTPDVALREAKLSLIHSSAVYRKPLYWGAFQLYTGS